MGCQDSKSNCGIRCVCAASPSVSSGDVCVLHRKHSAYEITFLSTLNAYDPDTAAHLSVGTLLLTVLVQEHYH